MATKTNKSSKPSKTLERVATLASETLNSTQDGRLYNEILDAILDHRLSPGVKLKEDELSSIF